MKSQQIIMFIVMNSRMKELGNYLYTLAAKINKVKQRFLIENITTQSSIIAVYSGSLNSFSQSNENFCMMLDAGCACLLYINLISSHIKMQRDKCPEFMLTVPI